MNDYEAPTPLWVAPGVVLADLAVLSHEDSLVQDLSTWQESFRQHFDVEKGWHDSEARERHELQGLALRDRLQRALPGVEIDLDLWCTTGTAPAW